MSDTTKIQWADSTFNPWIGCTKVSPGCANCYAEISTPARTKHIEWGAGKPRHLTKGWREPLKWNESHEIAMRGWEAACDLEKEGLRGIKRELSHFGMVEPRRRRVFPSLCDPFDPGVSIEWFVKFMDLIRRTPNLDWLLVTKRPELWFELMDLAIRCSVKSPSCDPLTSSWLANWGFDLMPRSNVWIIASVEDQQRADERIPALLKIPAVVRGLSCEPLLGPIDFNLVSGLRASANPSGAMSGRSQAVVRCPETSADATAAEHAPERTLASLNESGSQSPVKTVKPVLGCGLLSWVIVGGESGKNSRPCNVEWIRSIVAQCDTAQVPVFVKQMGSNAVYTDSNETECEFGVSHPEWPKDLRVQEWPKTNR